MLWIASALEEPQHSRHDGATKRDVCFGVGGTRGWSAIENPSPVNTGTN